MAYAWSWKITPPAVTPEVSSVTRIWLLLPLEKPNCAVSECSVVPGLIARTVPEAADRGTPYAAAIGRDRPGFVRRRPMCKRLLEAGSAIKRRPDDCQGNG